MGEAVVSMHGGPEHVNAHVCVHMRTIGEVFSAPPWWADVMLRSAPCLGSILAVDGAVRKVGGHLKGPYSANVEVHISM